MKNKGKLSAIKNELVRLIEKYDRIGEDFFHYGTGFRMEASLKKWCLIDFLDFVKSLPDEQSDNCDTCTNDTDYTKSNEEKAEEIKNYICQINKHYHPMSVLYGALQMAEWKDKQFKQDLDNAFKSADHVQYTNGYNDAVEKAWQYIKENFGGDYASETLVSECKKNFVEYMQEGEK